jgi:hypothetical protein
VRIRAGSITRRRNSRGLWRFDGMAQA